MSLLFSFQKLVLKRNINQNNYQQMLLSNRHLDIQSEIGVMEQAKAAMQDAWSTASNSVQVATNTVFAAQNNRATQDLNQMAEAYEKASPENKASAEAAMLAAQKAQTESADRLKLAQQAVAMGNVVANHAVNSVFAAADNLKLTTLQRQDQRIQLQMASLDSRGKKLSADYESVEKAEGESIKSEAPKFGMG